MWITFYLTSFGYLHIIEIVFFNLLKKFKRVRRCIDYENDISAKEAFQSESSWFQSENEYTGRKKGFSSQKVKRKKKIISVGRKYVAFSSIIL